MATIIRQQTTVDDTGRVSVQFGDLPKGASVEITLAISDAGASSVKLVDMVGSGTGLFETAEEVDAFINEERDSWHR